MGDTWTLSLVFAEHRRAEILRLADEVADPSSERYGAHLSRDELSQLVVLPEEERRACLDWLGEHGMKELASDSTSEQLAFVQGTEEQAAAALGVDPSAWLGVSGSQGAEVTIPRRLAGFIQRIGGAAGERGQAGMEVSGLAHAREPDPAISSLPGVAPVRAGDPPPASLAGITPAQIGAAYRFPDAWDGTGETIGVLSLGATADLADLESFWRGHGIEPPEVSLVHVGPSSGRPAPLPAVAEITACLQWAGAMAPGARLVLYNVDPAVMRDPWTSFLFAVIGDRHHTPTIAVTSWLSPERRYYQTFGAATITGLLAQAAALGITVISASGDWGPYDGVPRTVIDGRPVMDSPWPNGVFPAVEPRVLAVGGTILRSLDPVVETAWSGPPPMAVRPFSPFELLASGGGFSDVLPTPAWQRPALAPSYGRGPSSPGVVPFGRGFPDVAMMASGPPQQDGDAKGFQAVLAQHWVDFMFGTSIGAPIWAAIVARVNQARAARGLPRLGHANPVLYGLPPGALRPVTEGRSDVAMHAADDEGRASVFRVDGFRAGPGWDPVTGLGAPDVDALIEALTAPR